MHLIADVLDKQLIDVHGVNAGKVDGIVLELREGKPPKVAFVEVSPITLLRRFSARLAAWYATIDAKIAPDRGHPFRIPFSRVARSGPALRLDLDVESTPITRLEDWLSVKIVDRIPGATRK
jgi:hypothetical protein